ncbi:MAG: carbonic anhydrase [Myxococcales bacterium]
MRASDKLLLSNKSWVQEIREVDPTYFSRISNQQMPEFLWIGCSDSRVPANTITGTDPGEIFVHRNIANVVVPDDVNMLSVLQYAVEVLKVKHVIVCGHYGCGGVKASLGPKLTWPIEQWLGNIRAVCAEHSTEIEALPEDARPDRLCELSVRHQVKKLSRLPIIARAWETGAGPELHGWVYSIRDGVLHELVRVEPGGGAG